MILYYNSYDIFNNSTYSKDLANIPGGVEFSTMFKMFSQNITFSDRTETIKIPFKMYTPDFLKMPSFESFTGKSFDQICDERARGLLDHALASNRKLAVMYSGGVDSTLILCALLKVAKPEELKQIINKSVVGCDTYTNKNSLWLIFTDKKEWVIELTSTGSFWYNYYFFQKIFLHHNFLILFCNNNTLTNEKYFYSNVFLTVPLNYFFSFESINIRILS